MTPKQFMQKVALVLFGRYQLVRIYSKELHSEVQSEIGFEHSKMLEGSSEILMYGVEDLKSHSWYAGPEALGFGVFNDQKLVCMCWYWKGSDKRVPIKFFPTLGTDELVMVDFITAKKYRGRGHGSSLISYSERRLRALGYRRLWTWVWHSNSPSIRAFEKAGWKYRDFLVDFELFHLKHVRIRLPRR